MLSASLASGRGAMALNPKPHALKPSTLCQLLTHHRCQAWLHSDCTQAMQQPPQALNPEP